ncbi:MAG: 5-carboxymethyl-2-hydroxymuconate isomerase [Propionibacteriales bacterium]|nr:5-carboxymethyl-2-hydroxymuconate isomerase [Propionibacteriales bacterium]
MRFVSYLRDGIEGVGLVEGDRLLDLSSLYPTMQALVEAGDGGLAAAQRQRDGAASGWVDVEDVRLTAPLPRPRRCLFCVGLNYQDHFKEGDATRQGISSLPEYPAFFSKATGTVIGPGEPIGWPGHLSEKLDYEAELAVIVGRRGRDITAEQAESHVFGYTLANDVTVRDIQRRHGGQWNKGKSFDGTCPMGPVVVTPDELDRTQRLQAEVNGVLRQDCCLDLMVFSVDQLIASLSEGMTIQPGDILLTGTPAGVGYARTPPSFLQPGDEVVVRLHGIGQLRNTVGKDLGPLPTC